MSPIPASAWALGVFPRINPATFRSSMTSSLNFLRHRAGHLVLRVVSQSPDAPVAPVDLPLGFPPAPGSLLPPGLGPLPPLQSLLHLVAGPGVLVDLTVGVGAQGVDAGVDAAGPGGPAPVFGSGGFQSFRQMYHRPFSLLMLAS